MENKSCNPCQLELFEITPYSRNSESLQQRQDEKRTLFKIKMTTYATGETKNNFMDDCQHRSYTEAHVLRNIAKIYYKIINLLPELKGKEFKDIEKELISRIQKPR